MTSRRGDVRRVKVAILAVALPLGALTQPLAATRISAVRCDSTAPFAAPRLSWRGDVVQWAEWPVRLGESSVRARVIVVRMPAARVRITLEIARAGGQIQPWSLDDAPTDAHIAVNAGQFTDSGPWGWVVHKQRELQPPGIGPLSGALVVDRAGVVAVLTATELEGWRTTQRSQEAVQSYPILLTGDGRPPRALCDARAGLDLTHRDARLAVGVTRDGQVLFVLTRYEAPGGSVTRIPIGPTTPEMAEILRRLGADRALMLDGGLSAQMLVRSATDSARWPGFRSVPLALVGRVTR
ncbi:MAG: phosphodiester glycosidase family protein [Gemmatimonas sp.]